MKKPKISTNYFERDFQEFWPQTKKQIQLVIDHARIQSLKGSGVVAMESFSFELIEVTYRGVLKKGIFERMEELIRKHPQ